ncbi:MULTISPECIES: hypothetical protein [Bacillus]|uniref:hypothetical protein n=1 Tax=Bacillus TaxID=1386 RepID=UPI0008156584|nr:MULTISPECIES: hypothetical protein [Bacillus]TFW47173.1 hypothetical protein ES896_10525 [Bacillus sp. 005/A4HT-01/001]WOQ72524.1 hypothetical protein R0126_18415 [Bacillus stratosphericus]SCC06655.1 hypothetical protein GA0061086_102691 [Bacillus altitudinis]
MLKMLKKKKITKLQTKFLNKLFSIVDNNEEYLEFIKKKNQQLKNEEFVHISKVQFYDVYDNTELNKLIRGIGNLNRCEYAVELFLNYKKKRELNYLKMQYDYTSISNIGVVTFKNDLFVDKVTLAFTQINNNEVVVEFCINFKKIMNSDNWNEFIKDNKKSLNDKWFLGYFDIDKHVELKQFEFIHNSILNLRGTALQAKLADLLNLNLGRKYTLPQYNAINFPEKHLNDETFKNVFLFQTIKIDRNFMLVDLIRTEGLKLDFYYSNNYLFSPINILGLFATYRMDFYYFLFENIERHEINEIINKYFLNTSKRIKYRDYKWLINKMRSLNDNKLLGNYSESSVLVKEWKAYINGEETPLYFVSGKYTEKYNIIYSESLDHIRMAYSIQKENLVIYLASGSLIASLIGVILTLILK